MSTDKCPKPPKLPASVEDILSIVDKRFKDLKTGVSETSRIVEMLNQIFNALLVVPNGKDDLSHQVFSDSRLLLFLENSVIKSVRRFSPTEVIRALLIVVRAERLGVSELRELRRLALERLMDSTHIAPAPLGGLSVSQYCQLPLIVSSLDGVPIDVTDRLIDWMVEIVSRTVEL